jgi:hypothetical protein
VGRALGLDPNSLRLNGYYVSRSGSNYVSPGLLWGQLLDFFVQRELPCGGGIVDAVVVLGKHMGSTGQLAVSMSSVRVCISFVFALHYSM